MREAPLLALLVLFACAPSARAPGPLPAEPTRQEIRERLLLEARQAIAAEDSLAARPPIPNTVAVLPWTWLGADPSLKPLERGLAHLLVTDLSHVARLTLVERERVQLLTDELALAASGRVDSGTAARSGRLLGAALVVQGVIHETGSGGIRLDAAVVSATSSSIRATGTASDRLPRLFAMEKTVVFELLDRWNIPLTPAERRAISEQPTADLQAFLAFSRGLEAEDRGDFVRAGAEYRTASALDPSFSAARTRAETDRGATDGSAGRRALATVARRGGPSSRSAFLSAAIQNIAPTTAGRLHHPQIRLPALRSRLAEALRQDDAGRLGLLVGIAGTLPRH